MKNIRSWLQLDGLRSLLDTLRRARVRGAPAVRLGIAGWLTVAVIAVAVLAVVANLISDGKLAVVRISETRREQTEPVVLPPVRLPPVVKTLAPAPAPLPFPSADPLLRALERVDNAVDASADSDAVDVGARYPKLAADLDHTAAVFASAAKAAGEAPPPRFMPVVRSYAQQGGELIKLAAARRQSMEDYSSHYERLNARVKKALDHAWQIFGRVVARQSLVKLTGNLDELRRRYAEVVSTDTVDSLTFDALGASEEALAKTLVQDRGGLTRADGKDWYAKSLEDLQAMASARKSLQQIDRQRKERARRFGDAFATVSQIVGEMGKTETYDARQLAPQVMNAGAARAARSPAMQPPARMANASLAQATNVSSTQARDERRILAREGADSTGAFPLASQASGITQTSATETSRIGVVSRDSAGADAGTSIQRSVNTTLLEAPNERGNTLIAWISGAVLLLVVSISVFTAFSIMRPVRRLLGAASRVANGEIGVIVPRGGLRELDTLAVAFNNMAAQVAEAQEAAREHQHLLEVKIAERTQQLEELAQLDHLTRLANRRQFFALLNAAIDNAVRENRFVGVFFLDIDNFKSMNDSLGHEFGDHLLQTIAQRLSELTHSFGFAARLGGDEFTVVYESASSIEDVRLAGLQLVKAFEDPLSLDGRQLVVSISAGASVYPDHAKDPEALLRAADTALYQAKALGRGQLALFTPALLEAATARFTIELGLRRALERGEFHLVFQPEVNLRTGETELVEALLRWRLPDGRYASPGEFLGVAEASGLIFQINDWVLRRALETLAHWHHGPWPGARVAINVSSRQLFDHHFAERVQAQLAEYKLPPSCIEIELTEHVLQTGSTTIAALHRLREQGIAIALDDFGAGFSSLASLEQLPLTRIKLDRSLVASIDTSARSASIARAIIQLCHDLGLAVTAEGIERLEQLGPLIGYPALHAQGYLLAQPQSSDEVLHVMQTLPALTRALVRSSVARLPEAQLAEKLPFVTADVER